MRILNIHSRTFPVAASEVGKLVDSLSSPNDRLWPHDRWPAMRLERALEVGARGGHGPIRYEVAEYIPGRFVRFRFNARKGLAVGLEGEHRFEVRSDRPDASTLIHTVEGESKGGMIWKWPVLFRCLHDALLEDSLDRAELHLTGRIASPASWSPLVRLYRRLLKGA